MVCVWGGGEGARSWKFLKGLPEDKRFRTILALTFKSRFRNRVSGWIRPRCHNICQVWGWLRTHTVSCPRADCFSSDVSFRSVKTPYSHTLFGVLLRESLWAYEQVGTGDPNTFCVCGMTSSAGNLTKFVCEHEPLRNIEVRIPITNARTERA